MRELLNPDLYHGKHKKSNFFEGWYFKIVSKDESRVLAFIPGIALGKDSTDSHSFIQVLDGNNLIYKYSRYNKDDFTYIQSPFSLNISNNSFSLEGINLNLSNSDLDIRGHISFKNLVRWKDSKVNPGSMGFYNYLPFMECYAQVSAVDGQISGKLIINNELIDYNGGKVYIEKNWGKSFPIEWLWIQSNNFKDNRATLTCSIGQIPFPIKDFRGFLIGLTIDNIFYKFTTINRSKLTINYHKSGVEVISTYKNLRLYIKTYTNKDDFILCYGPKSGVMSPYVRETLIGKVYMKIDDIICDQILYEGFGLNAGIEYGGTLMDKVNFIGNNNKV